MSLRQIMIDGKELRSCIPKGKKSSLCDKTPKQMGECIRNHWAIENELHWQLDVTFKEDDSKVRAENAIINLHLIRKWALFLLKKEPSKISLKRKKAARCNQFLKSILE